jgi:hypothetical protein
MILTTHSHLTLRKEWSYTSTPLLGLHGLLLGELYLLFFAFHVAASYEVYARK